MRDSNARDLDLQEETCHPSSNMQRRAISNMQRLSSRTRSPRIS